MIEREIKIVSKLRKETARGVKVLRNKVILPTREEEYEEDKDIKDNDIHPLLEDLV